MLTEGFQSAFVACVALAALGVLVALTLLGTPRKARRSGWSRPAPARMNPNPRNEAKENP